MIKISQRKRRLLIYSVVWACLLVLLSVQPDRLVLAVLPTHVLRTAAHCAAYAVFAFILCLYFRFLRNLMAIRMTDLNVALVTLVVALVWGVLNEVIQLYLPDRYFDLEDIFADGVGVAAGVLAFMIYKNIHRRPHFIP